MANKEVHKDENGEYVLMESGPKGNHQFTKVYLDELGYDPREIKCKNCGAPIERNEVSEPLKKIYGDIQGYWRHVRDVHTGRIWCYPTKDMVDQDFTRAAEPEETDA